MVNDFDSSGSTSIGRRSTEDDSPAPQKKCDEDHEKVEGSNVETPLQMSAVKSTTGESVFDVCEVFSPPRICEAACQRGVRGGRSLDVSST